MMMVITFASLLFAIFPFVGINLARTGKTSIVSGFQESYKTENLMDPTPVMENMSLAQLMLAEWGLRLEF